MAHKNSYQDHNMHGYVPQSKGEMNRMYTLPWFETQLSFAVERAICTSLQICCQKKNQYCLDIKLYGHAEVKIGKVRRYYYFAFIRILKKVHSWQPFCGFSGVL